MADRDDLRDLTEAIEHLAEMSEQFVPRDEMEVMMTERRVRRRLYALTALGVAAVVIALSVLGYQLLTEIRHNQRLIEQYNREHAENSAISHKALEDNIRCQAEFFASRDYTAQEIEALDPRPAQTLAECFSPKLPMPPPKPDLKGDGGG